MVRRFTQASSEYITFGLGSCNIDCDGITIATIAKKVTDGSWQTIITGQTSGALNRFQMQFTDVNTLFMGAANGDDSGSGGIAAALADGWCLYVVSKDTGTVQPRMHKFVYSTKTWTHATQGTAFTNGTAPGVGGSIKIGRNDEFGEYANADVAVVGVWDSFLTDAQVELLAQSIRNWSTLTPTGLWIFNQPDVTTTVKDYTGNGADQTARTGTTANDVVVPFSVRSISNNLRPSVFVPGIGR